MGIWNYLAYGAGDIYGGGAYFILSTFTMFYLINVVGMNPLLAGLIPAIGKIWDAVSDPIMGYISDRTPPNRFGKRRLWFLIAIIPIAISFVLLWLPVNISTMTGKFIYYVIAYILFFTVSTMSYIPYTALSAEMTVDSKERNNLNGTRIFFSYFATILVALIAKPIIDAYDGGRYGYLVMGIIFSLIFALPWITLFLGTWELPDQVKKKKKEHPVKNFLSVFKNKTGRKHILLYIFSYGTMDILMAWFLFFTIDYLNKNSMFVYLQGTLIVTMMIALVGYVYLSTKKGHMVSYILGLSLFLAGMIFMAFQGPNSSFKALIANVVLIGAGLSAGALVPKLILPFVVDLDRLISGQERAGTYASAMALSRKLFHALIIMNGLGILLSVIGYKQPVPTVLLPAQYQHAIELSMDKPIIQNSITKSYFRKEDGSYYLKAENGKENKLSETEIYNLSKNLKALDFQSTGIGDQRKVVQSKATVSKLRVLFIILPMFMAFTGIVIAFFYKMTPQNHRVIVDEIERLENGGSKEDVAPHTRAICEELTGLPYEKMYGG
ncbi:MAG: MFS transporter [Deltaproteobacteria bacterium]|nr:MFS transporter [Deltaproteobacteria bacterium]MBW1847855.1 MFS transporter [Deltaproteobacteria bacterium]MBW1984513.1 MFS transporter [Deltaproteobacteria bacterium]MBW2179117.1 MFS transporter [Deltaproteobacteria bacterium]